MDPEMVLAQLALHVLARRPGCSQEDALNAARVVATWYQGQSFADAANIVRAHEEAVDVLDQHTNSAYDPMLDPERDG